MLEYLLRLTIIWAVWLAFLGWTLRGNRQWILRRRLILGMHFSGLLIPLIPTLISPGTETAFAGGFGWAWETMSLSQSGNLVKPGGPEASYTWIWVVVYVLGVLLHSITMLREQLRLQRWRNEGVMSVNEGKVTWSHPEITSPCTDGRFIYVPPDMINEELKISCLHEAAHIDRHHVPEQWYMAGTSLLFWFHPLQWMFRRSLTATHEFEADDCVLVRVSVRDYGTMLISQSQLATTSLLVGFNSSTLKNRIMMLNQRKQMKDLQPRHWWLILLFGVVLIVACSDVVEQSGIDRSLPTWDHVEVPPVPISETVEGVTGGDGVILMSEALLKPIYTEIRYPVEARNQGVEAILRADFIIDEFGSLQDLTVQIEDEPPHEDRMVVIVGYGAGADNAMNKETEEVLLEEVSRVMYALRAWKPAQDGGRTLSVRGALWFKYMLE